MIAMKVTKEKSAENRRALVRAASKLFKQHGIDGVGVAEIGKEAGLTHGALYAQFASKEELAAEALADGLERGFERRVKSAGEDFDLGDYLDWYLSKRHCDNLETGCAMTASGSEIARQGKRVSRAFVDGFERFAKSFEEHLGPSDSEATDRDRALAIVSAAIGAVVLSRAVSKADAKLAGEILNASRLAVDEIGGLVSKKHAENHEPRGHA
jgi:TetR/AcrR family transcriptional regulator, transcriptional repressor for nem operon